ncbi:MULTISPECIES: hypothetical protein [unclassified Microbacterium]|uniref:hypothetical protein n=1 Tax=unclassified Microbacterium TaxID=2609290 RepID=UPI001E50BDDD|nr:MULTISPECIES: hypothetical protein [unclassified Microbacterium]HWK78659.1 hypothetical protein [Microbacterium sp.]
MSGQTPAESPFHSRLPIGERLDASALTEGLPWAFDEIRMRPLEPMLVPENPRGGEIDRSTCGPCAPSENTIWHDDLWQVYASPEPSGLPFIAALSPREHWLLEDAPIDVLAALGPLMQRMSEAVKTIPGVARCHFGRWNDGSAHLHMWALARPAGMMQGRGAALAFWDDVLPPMPQEMAQEHVRIVAESLAAGGGVAFPHR